MRNDEWGMMNVEKKIVRGDLGRKLIILILTVMWLSGCVSIQSTPEPSITPGNPATSTPTITQSATPRPTATITLTRKPTWTLTPSLTPVPPELMLTEFGLALHTTWTYSVGVSYLRPDSDTELDSWAGTVTVRVTDQTTDPAGNLVFTVIQEVDPSPPSQVWLGSRAWEYIVAENGISESDFMKVYQWPLSNDAEWKAFDSSNYVWKVNSEDEVVTSFAKYADCFQLRLDTMPDTSISILCPGIGIVKKSYYHHGEPQIEEWELQSYTVGEISE